jgi:hypothetical protein
MGYILPSFIKQNCYGDMPKTLLETGTFKGGVAIRMLEDNTLDMFDKIYTIELSEKCCKVSSTRYKKYENELVHDGVHPDEEDESFSGEADFFGGRLTLINGDSAVEIKKVLEKIDHKAAFWLDAHAGSKADFARGDVDVPLLLELEAIKQHPIKNHFIAIDDGDLLGKKQMKNGECVCDYSDVTFELVEQKIKEINPDYNVQMVYPYSMAMVIATV